MGGINFEKDRNQKAKILRTLFNEDSKLLQELIPECNLLADLCR